MPGSRQASMKVKRLKAEQVSDELKKQIAGKFLELLGRHDINELEKRIQFGFAIAEAYESRDTKIAGSCVADFNSKAHTGEFPFKYRGAIYTGTLTDIVKYVRNDGKLCNVGIKTQALLKALFEYIDLSNAIEVIVNDRLTKAKEMLRDSQTEDPTGVILAELLRQLSEEKK